ncbi:MAG: cytochrome P450 [Actinomycetia bacterium]|nr:cytochrome P450 [Actinomycetes bacterium]
MTALSQAEEVMERIAQANQSEQDLRISQPSGVVRPPHGPNRMHALVAALRGRILSLEFLDEFYSTKPIAYLHLGGEHMYALSDPALIWEAYASNDAKVSRARQAEALTPVTGRGVLTSRGEEHRRNRKLVQPSFSPKHINSYGADMVAAANECSDKWMQRTTSGPTEVLLAQEMSELTLDIIGRTIFGSDLSGAAKDVSTALTELLSRARLMTSPIGKWLTIFPNPLRKRLVRAIARLDAVVDQMIASKKVSIASGSSSDEMLTRLINTNEDGETLSDTQLRDEVMTLVLAGHETTANALSWTFLHLSENPEVQDWLADEWRQFAHRDVTTSDYAHLHRTRAVIAESMRLTPPVPSILRYVVEDFELAGYRIPAGSTLFASQYFMHRDPAVWPHATEFVPQRWLTEDGSFSEKAPGQPKGAWFPFGFASRKCLGDRFAWLEATLVLATLGPTWKITALDPGAVRPIPAVTLRPSTGVPALLQRR